MNYLLDTNICVRWLRADQGGSTDWVVSRPVGERIFLCSVVKAELFYGAHHSSRVAANLGQLSRLYASFKSFSFDDEAADIYGTLRSRLAR